MDASDPSGKGLFSKCARNHASRTKPNYRQGPSSRPNASVIQMSKIKYSKNVGFESQVSREEREKMYRTGEVPPVGHYHPLKKDRPKLVWDILKAYNHRNKK